MSTGVKISDINWAWNETILHAENQNAILEIKEFYKKSGLPFWWWVYSCGQSPETTRTLLDAGLRLFAKVPCMAADLNECFLDDHLPENIKVVSVKTQKDLDLWKDVSFDGFEMPSHKREQYGAFVSSFNLGFNSQQRLFLAYIDETPVATSLLFTHKETAGIYYVSTLPAYRNQGCGLKITQAAMHAAKNNGFSDITLQATPLGARVYRRAGFKECCLAEIYKI
ncbi:MAG: GNAT family N-acetyltransferase, partial [Smithella sp.]|nr:GNAT family N-acetyltransferase [Smithella sp.]